MPPLLFSTILAGLLGTGVQGSYLYRYLLVADGQCDHFKRCRGAESLTECKAWSKHMQGSTQNVTVDSSIPSPYGCVLNGDGEEVLYRAKKNATCSTSQKCICRCEDNTRYGKGTANRLINVALYADGGATTRGKGNAYTVLNYEEAGMRTVNFTASDYARHLNLENYDAVYFPGGGGGTQARMLGPGGISAVRNFVANGGGYVGVCAGAYLSFEMNISAFEDVIRPRGGVRGDGNTTLELTDEGAAALPKVTKAGIKSFEFFYANGPVMDIKAEIPEGVTDPVVFARYHSASVPIEKNYTGPYAGYGFAAVVSNVFNASSSRVVISGPHPETNEMDFPDLDGPPSPEGSERAHLLQAYIKHAVPGVR